MKKLLQRSDFRFFGKLMLVSYLLFMLVAFLSSCGTSRFGNGCPDARRAIGYGCYRGR